MKFEEFIKSYNEIIKSYNNIYHAFALEYGLSDSAMMILYELRVYKKEITQKDLGGYLSLSKQTINSSIKNLLDSGFVELKECEADKRIKSVVLTKKGELFCKDKIDIIIKAEQKAYNRLSDIDRETLLSMEKKYFELLLEEADKVRGK